MKFLNKYYFLFLFFSLILAFSLINTSLLANNEISSFTFDYQSKSGNINGNIITPDLEINWEFTNANHSQNISKKEFFNFFSSTEIRYYEYSFTLEKEINNSNYFFTIVSNIALLGYSNKSIVTDFNTFSKLNATIGQFLDSSFSNLIKNNLTLIPSNNLNPTKENEVFLNISEVNFFELFQSKHIFNSKIWINFNKSEYSDIKPLYNSLKNKENTLIGKIIKYTYSNVNLSYKSFLNEKYNYVLNEFAIINIDLFFGNQLVMIFIILICLIFILLIFLQLDNKNISILLIRGEKFTKTRNRLIFGFNFSLIIIFILTFSFCILIFSQFIDFYNLLVIWLSLSLIYSFVVNTCIFLLFRLINIYLKPDIHPADFKINVYSKATFLDKRFLILFPEISLTLLIFIVLLELVKIIDNFTIVKILNASLDPVIDMVWFMFFVAIGISIFVFLNKIMLIFLTTRFKENWIKIIPISTYNLSNILKFLLIMILINGLIIQTGSIIYENNIHANTQNLIKSGNAQFIPPNNVEIKPVLNFLNSESDLTAYYVSYQTPLEINNKNFSITLIGNETSFIKMRPYIDGIVNSKELWSNVFEKHNGILIHKALLNSIILNSNNYVKVKISSPENQYLLNLKVLGYYEGGIAPIYTNFVSSFSYIENLEKNFTNDLSIANHSWMSQMENFYNPNGFLRKILVQTKSNQFSYEIFKSSLEEKFSNILIEPIYIYKSGAVTNSNRYSQIILSMLISVILINFVLLGSYYIEYIEDYKIIRILNQKGVNREFLKKIFLFLHISFYIIVSCFSYLFGLFITKIMYFRSPNEISSYLNYPSWNTIPSFDHLFTYLAYVSAILILILIIIPVIITTIILSYYIEKNSEAI